MTLFAFLVALLAPAAWSASFPVWITSSLERTGQTDPPGIVTQADLAAAQQEYAAFQIVIKAPSTGLTGVNVTASPLTGAGHSIDPRNIGLYREHYVYVDRPGPDWHGPNQSRGAGWYPDPLIPFVDPATGNPPARATLAAANFRLDAAKNQPLWADVYVPSGTPPGVYTGNIQITADQGQASIPVKLTVWNFALPLAPSMKSLFQLWSPADRNTVEELLRHKVMPQKVAPRDEPQLIRKFGLNMTTTGFWSGADNSNCTMSQPPSTAQFRKAAASHAKGLFLANYTADEIDHCRDLTPNLEVWGMNMHPAGIKNLLVMTPVPQLFSAVDIWVVMPKMYDAAGPQIAQARAHGAEIWSYNTLVQDGYSPKWTIDFDPIGIRLQAGFLSQTLGLTGLLYWRMDKWGSDPWNNVNNSGVFSANNYPGEGVLVYPGGPVGVSGVVASLRLKQIRQGIQDYEYVEILKKLGQGDWALQQIKRIAPDWKNWTRDAKSIEAVRRELGEKISSLAAHPAY